MEDAIRTYRLTKYYGGRKVVDRLDLSVPRGAIYALLGDNGAGKSTTIRMLTGLLPADSGRAVILGQDCWSAADSLRHRVGYVPEKPRFYDWMTVREIGWFCAGFHRPGFLARYDFGFADLTLAANEAKGLLIIAAFSTFRNGSGRSNYFTREFFYRETRGQTTS